MLWGTLHISSPLVISDTDRASVVRTVGSSLLVTFEIHVTTPGTSCPPLCGCQSSELGYLTQTSHICLGTGLSYLMGLLPTVGHFLNCNHLVGVSICCLLQERGRKVERVMRFRHRKHWARALQHLLPHLGNIVLRTRPLTDRFEDTPTDGTV